MYELVNSKIFYWKNRDYSSHMLHPFMYNLKLWNRLNNIIINGYKDYVNSDLIGYMSSKVKFDELFGKYGEAKKFWKYNVLDLTGYTTRYEAAIKDEHLDDFNNTVSELTGYDGLFYPNAVQAFIDLMTATKDDGDQFTFPQEFFTHGLAVGSHDKNADDKRDYFKKHPFIAAMYSIYWQLDNEDMYGSDYDGLDSLEKTFYIRWYSHLNYTRSEYHKIAMQLWYWRDRIKELAQMEYPMAKYCLDVQGNSLILMQTFKPGDEDSNPYLIDLALAHEAVQSDINENKNTHVEFCDNKLVKPAELWIRWKSNPIAIPAFDLLYDKETGDEWFDFHHRGKQKIEMGQLTHSNNDCNEAFKLVLSKWRNAYGKIAHWKDDEGNELS